MVVVRIEEFDLKKIALSGQCFRMRFYDDGSFGAVAKQRFVRIEQTGDCQYDFSCSKKEFDSFWADYFDLSTDYSKFYEAADNADDYLRRAVEFGRGIRILRQDPWEASVSFILSQRRNIPAICKSIEALCKRFGTPLDTVCGTVYGFPTPRQIADASLCDLRECSVGYRDKYILHLARSVCTGALSLQDISAMDDETAKRALTGAYGIGEKVASCILLFGYHRLSMFPMDVWIKRVVQQKYGGSFPLDRYRPFAGVMQQYLFAYARCEKVR